MDKAINFFFGATVLASAYLLAIFIFDVVLRGFAPFVPSRPWVIDKILNNLKLKKFGQVYSFGSGKSGFLREFEKIFPGGRIIGVEKSFFAYLAGRTQLFLRRIIGHRLNIRIVWKDPLRLDISGAEIIYNHLTPEEMSGLGKKLKFECRPGTIVISNGFLIPDLEPSKEIMLDEREGRLAWLSRSREIFHSKRKKSIQENKVYFYEI